MANDDRPAPRPAFRTGSDGTTRPAPERLTSFQTQLPPAAHTPRDRPNEAPPKGKAGDELVELKVRMPRSVRKRLRVQAEAAGYTAEDAVYHLVRSWLQA